MGKCLTVRQMHSIRLWESRQCRWSKSWTWCGRLPQGRIHTSFYLRVTLTFCGQLWVWAPANAKPGDDLPVMVYTHGTFHTQSEDDPDKLLSFQAVAFVRLPQSSATAGLSLPCSFAEYSSAANNDFSDWVGHDQNFIAVNPAYRLGCV